MNYIGQRFLQVLSEIKNMFTKLSSLEEKTNEIREDIIRLERISLRNEESLIEIKEVLDGIKYDDLNIKKHNKNSKELMF